MNGTAPRKDDDEAFPDVDAVEFGGTPSAKINYLSVSQLKTAKACQRKWWLKKVAGLEEPKTAALDIGTEVHAQLEHYLKTGEDVRGDIARAADPLLPKPKGDFLLEHPITKNVRPIEGALIEADGIPLVGFIDRIDREQSRGPWPRVVDYKTSSNPEKWGSTPEQLVTTEHEHGIQMVGYALAASKMFPHADEIELEHLTMSKKRAGAVRQTLATITPDRARQEWQRMNLLARELRKVARIAKVEDTPSAWGTDACDQYGGCHFFGTCVVAEASKRPPVAPEKPKMSLRDLLAKRSAPPHQLTSEPPKEPKPEADIAKAAAEQATAKLDAAEPLPQVVPPDAPKSDPAKAAEPPPEPAPPKPAEEKKKRGPKPKDTAQNPVDTSAAGSAPVSGNPVQSATVPTGEKPSPSGAEVEGFSLFIDCISTSPGARPVALFDVIRLRKALGEYLRQTRKDKR